MLNSVTKSQFAFSTFEVSTSAEMNQLRTAHSGIGQSLVGKSS